MRKDYYNPMRNLAIIVLFLAAMLFSDGRAAQQPQATMKAAALESHEGVTISAQPWTDAANYKAKFPKKSPLASGIVAIDTIIRNDSDDSMKVDLEQIRLNVAVSEDNRQALRSLTPDDVADVMSAAKKKDPTLMRRSPIPIPTGPKVGRDKHWTEAQKAAADAGVSGECGCAPSCGARIALLRFAGAVRSARHSASLHSGCTVAREESSVAVLRD